MKIIRIHAKPGRWLACTTPADHGRMMYAQVITLGFLVVLEAEGQTYEYHMDMGRFVVLCEDRSRWTSRNV